MASLSVSFVKKSMFTLCSSLLVFVVQSHLLRLSLSYMHACMHASATTYGHQHIMGAISKMKINFNQIEA
jgi:hypothetical protein